MNTGRSKVNDGWNNRIEFYLTTHFEPVWRLVQRIPVLRRKVNRALINRAISKTPPRPNPLSTMASYTSWRSLTDRTFDGRHLPPVPDGDGSRPDLGRTTDLFLRRGDGLQCPKSTVLFANFAQWFTDGFLRSDRSLPRDPRKNTSNHEIDLSQLYGLNREVTKLLRAGEGGLLKSQVIDGEEFPPYLCRDGVVKPEFQGLSVIGFDELSDAQKNQLFAMGGDRGNSQVGYSMMNVLFLREHNRVARLLARDHPEWDDDRIFETARDILIVMLIRIVVEDYIRHIAPYHFKFFLDPSAFPNERWYRQNWMAIEFNLLYRWHSLVPSTLQVGEESMPIAATVFNNEVLVRHGLGALFESSSRQAACRIGLFNTDPYLEEVERASIVQAREVHLAPYNDYREIFSFPRVTDFDQISGDPTVQRALRELYGSVDKVELYVGLFAEDLRPDSALPALMARMVGVDALSQALTNPLLAPRIFTEQTFTPLGMRLIRQTRSLSDVLNRNLPDGSRRYDVRMTRRDWRRGAPGPGNVPIREPAPVM
ncbi:prostaglandin-endoperoxide synthase 2 [Thermomonospora echinospora]|uniref:Prostaglandin-endoperoxide synthase 2 n=1 Tax=Thermomonospora echinospora TaxID=1992 RepID=A0A1H6E828_9ACTN|nr:peroxidase family protein [Thermomonospora echinospora]SEG93309.1 prostaglandin-endoperoxide synthase 2 [Thermomonospora echinospora]